MGDLADSGVQGSMHEWIFNYRDLEDKRAASTRPFQPGRWATDPLVPGQKPGAHRNAVNCSVSSAAGCSR